MKMGSSLKPQDLVVLLKVLVRGKKPWRHVELAYELGMSQSEVSSALERAKRLGLLDATKKKVQKAALKEFLKYALKFMFPAEPGPMVRGLPTAHSAPPLSNKIVSKENDKYVWPYAEGNVRGQSIEPLYPCVPEAAMKDPRLYELLALVDALRVGRAREKVLALDELWFLIKKVEGAP